MVARTEAPRLIGRGNVGSLRLCARQPRWKVERVGRPRPRAEPELIARAALDPTSNDEALLGIVAAARLRALGDLPRNKAEALQLAPDYQLIGDGTNFLLVYECVAGEKAKDKPEHVKVKSMVPTGYGGFASVAELSCDYAMSCARPMLT